MQLIGCCPKDHLCRKQNDSAAACFISALIVIKIVFAQIVNVDLLHDNGVFVLFYRVCNNGCDDCCTDRMLWVLLASVIGGAVIIVLIIAIIVVACRLAR